MTLFGRRRGRRLSQHKEHLLSTLLPQIQITLPTECTVFNPYVFFPPEIRSVWLEIGFGYGEHLAEVSRHNPNVGVIGCESFVNGVVNLLSVIEREQLDNIRIFHNDAHLLLNTLAHNTIERCFILFPDPWRKKRHHKRRFINTTTLDQLSDRLTDAAELRLATDDPSLIRWMLEHTWRHRDFYWLAHSAVDWRRRTPDWYPSRYEQKALTQGRKPIFLRFRRHLRTPE